MCKTHRQLLCLHSRPQLQHLLVARLYFGCETRQPTWLRVLLLQKPPSWCYSPPGRGPTCEPSRRLLLLVQVHLSCRQNNAMVSAEHWEQAATSRSPLAPCLHRLVWLMHAGPPARRRRAGSCTRRYCDPGGISILRLEWMWKQVRCPGSKVHLP